nr:putative receptor-like protein kinase At4g00960 [Ipomoea batatas]
MDLQKWIAFHIFLSLNLVSITIADIGPNHEYHECGTRGRYTQDSTYSKNLDTLLSSLSKNVSEYGFYKGSVGQDSERASAIVLCRGDVELNVCRSCISDNAQRIKQRCPNQKEAFRWYNICSIYYSDESITGSLRTTPKVVQYSNISYPYPAQFSEDLTNMVGRLRRQAADGGPFLKYAANSTAGSDLQTIYAYVQCTPDLSHQDCTDCLSTAFTLWYKSNGNGKIRARVLCPSCFFHYENSSFFGATLIKVPPSAPPPPSPPSHRIAIVIVVSTVTGLIMITICIFLMQKRKAKSYAANVEESSSGDEISPVESHLKYELITIQTATDNFSKANKVGEGRFGAVYKGKLENRQLVAVKRLSENSRQVNLELKNEMALMARLQHRNLAWTHFKSGAASNVIDPMLRAVSSPVHEITKCIHIALLCVQESVVDRPTMFEVLQMLSNLSMSLPVPLAPGFSIHGSVNTEASSQFTKSEMSNSSDQYPRKMQKRKANSYAKISALESLKCDFSTIQNGTDNFSDANMAWTHWKNGSSLNVIDPMLRGVSSPVPDIIKCVQVALLCVQEKVEDRPTMGEVVQMLSNLSTSLPVPSAPPFVIPSRVSSEGSINEMPISDDDEYPR